MGAPIDYNHDFGGKKFDDMNSKEQEAVKKYEEAMGYNDSREYPESKDNEEETKSIEDYL
jgi:hypothetical protein